MGCEQEKRQECGRINRVAGEGQGSGGSEGGGGAFGTCGEQDRSQISGAGCPGSQLVEDWTWETGNRGSEGVVICYQITGQIGTSTRVLFLNLNQFC